MRIPARLVTLSGLPTGMNVVAAGDGLLGFSGVYFARAVDVLLSLWDVQTKRRRN